MTGLYEESHGIVANEMYDPVFNETFSLSDPEDVIKSKWFDDGGEPIWVTNQKQSTPSLPRRSGSLFWPGSMASVHGYLPTKYLAYDPNMKFEERVDIIISWFLDKDPIDLGLLYYEHPDEEGHVYGPESDNMTLTIQKLEACTGYLLDSLDKNNLLDTVNVILTSDHGMTTTPNDKTIVLGDYIQKDLYKVIVMNNPIVSIIPQNGKYKLPYCIMCIYPYDTDGHYLELKYPYLYYLHLCFVLTDKLQIYSFLFCNGNITQ